MGQSDSATSFQLRLTARTPLGRDKVKLQWQVAPLGAPFTSTNVLSGTSAAWTDAITSSTVLAQNVTGLSPNTAYHWRVRLLYRPGNALGQSASRWLHIPWNGWNEQDFRTAKDTGPATTVIRYTYDPLQRLTSATYSDGKSFQYAYDAVGNRTISTQTITSTLVTTYTYDAANRLANVNSVPYTWDNNGNLKNDGSKVYTYTQANQLITVTAPGLTWSASYNGDGARLKQIVNGVPTTYTLDLAAPLVTVLEQHATRSTQYVYGLGDSPLAVYTGTWTYLSGRDGLNSVRQETDAAGNVLTARSFDPYGVPLSGDGGAPFGYTGEIADVTGLVFLRARYMQPGLGRFVQGDPSGLERNLHVYAGSNPVNRTDPSGLFSRDIVANSFDLSSFEEVLSHGETWGYGNLDRLRNRWGWIATLLRARDGDLLKVGSPELLAIRPYVQWSPLERVWLSSGCKIMIGDQTLMDYAATEVGRDREQFFWRDGSASYYYLLSDGISVFIDGPGSANTSLGGPPFYTDNTIDLPDFHSVDVYIPTAGAVGWNGNAIVDRFGNIYVTLIGAGVGPAAGVAYSEGYVCSNGLPGCSKTEPSLDDDSALKHTIGGFCVNVGIGFLTGGIFARCGSLGGPPHGVIGIASKGPAAWWTLGGATWTWDFELSVPSLGWNWAFRDRKYGITLDYVRTLPAR